MLTPVTIAGLDFPNNIFSASGLIKNMAQLRRILFLPDGSFSGVGSPFIGSVMYPKREGNQGRTYHSNAGSCLAYDITSANSVGLSGGGWEEEYQFTLGPMFDLIRSLGLPVVVNVAAFNPQEYAFLVERVYALGADLVVINLSCGNTGGDVLVFEDDFVRPMMARVVPVVPQGKQIFFKVPYFPSRGMLRRRVEYFNRFEVVGGFAGINTLANGLWLDPGGVPYIDPYGGFAGIGGADIRHVALGTCAMLREYARPDMAIIGCGGIQTPEHVRAFRKYTDAVKVNTIVREEGSGVFGRLSEAA